MSQEQVDDIHDQIKSVRNLVLWLAGGVGSLLVSWHMLAVAPQLTGLKEQLDAVSSQYEKQLHSVNARLDGHVTTSPHLQSSERLTRLETELTALAREVRSVHEILNRLDKKLQ